MIDVPLNDTAAFSKQGSILPLHVSTSLLNNGNSNSSNSYTFLIHTPKVSGELIE